MPVTFYANAYRRDAFSLDDVFMNLRQEIGKAQIIKILTSLADSGKLLCKTYGKQQVFVSNQVWTRSPLIHQFTTQELLEKPSQEELDDLDKQMQEMQETLSQMKDKNHQLTLGILK